MAVAFYAWNIINGKVASDFLPFETVARTDSRQEVTPLRVNKLLCLNEGSLRRRDRRISPECLHDERIERR